MTEPQTSTDRAQRRAGGALFVVTILLGSFLLFLVQPMIARMALPRLGGAPAVWNSAMLVYQALLLGGYAYAHWLRRWPVRVQAAIQSGILIGACLWLPIGLMAIELPADINPVLWVPWLLTLSIGPLFLAVAAQAPLVQRWFSTASGGADPYALYAASNLGSFGGLIAYPLLAEPLLPISGQRWAWSAGYIVLTLLVMLCWRRLPTGGEDRTIEQDLDTPPPGRRRIATWILLACVPSGLMLATTTFLTTDIVAVPMLWVVPLGLYLLSFTLAFATTRWPAVWIAKLAPVVVLMFGGLIIAGNHAQPVVNAVMALSLLLVVSTALHTRLFDLRPEPRRLTGFYLAMAVGGVIGGIFAALIAPVVFDWTYEYPILILAAGLLLWQAPLIPPGEWLWRGPARRRFAGIAVILVASVAIVLLAHDPDQTMPDDRIRLIAFIGFTVLGLIAIGQWQAFMVVLIASMVLNGGWSAIETSLYGGIRTRSYFGVYTINERDGVRDLTHGTTLHGVQLTGSPERERTPTTYYVPGSGVGLAMTSLDRLYGSRARVGVVGLGTGTLACYAQPGQSWRFYEIDLTVVELSREKNRFSFLSRCLPNADIRMGDARIRLSREPSNSLDLLVLDAFSSDAVPLHLMTREAFATYRRVLAPNGLLLVHISNRYLALAPVVAAIARRDGWAGRRLIYTPEDGEEMAGISDWIALSGDAATIERLTLHDSAWLPLDQTDQIAPWTDDHASILPVLLALHPEFAR